MIGRWMSALGFLLLLGGCAGGSQSNWGAAPGSSGYPEGLEPRNSVSYMRP